MVRHDGRAAAVLHQDQSRFAAAAGRRRAPSIFRMWKLPCCSNLHRGRGRLLGCAGSRALLAACGLSTSAAGPCGRSSSHAGDKFRCDVLSFSLRFLSRYYAPRLRSAALSATWYASAVVVSAPDPQDRSCVCSGKPETAVVVARRVAPVAERALSMSADVHDTGQCESSSSDKPGLVRASGLARTSTAGTATVSVTQQVFKLNDARRFTVDSILQR
jgi:hypothetical protein